MTGRNWSDASPSQGVPRFLQKPGGKHGADSPSETSEGTNPADSEI